MELKEMVKSKKLIMGELIEGGGEGYSECVL